MADEQTETPVEQPTEQPAAPPIEKTLPNDLYAFAMRDAAGRYGVITLMTNQGAVPLIAFSNTGVARFRPMAQAVASQENKTVCLVKYSNPEELETIEPSRIIKP
jgi:hypothetical protein